MRLKSGSLLCGLCLFISAIATPVFAIETMLSSQKMKEVVQHAQCEIKCTKKFGDRLERTLNSGETVVRFNLDSDAYKQCQSGCRNSFIQAGRFSQAFQQGQDFHRQSEISAENVTTSPVAVDVALKCVTVPEAESSDDQSPPSMGGLVVIKLNNLSSEPIRFIFEIRYRAFAPKTGEYEEELQSFGLTNRTAIWLYRVMVPTVQYRFVVTTVDVGGPVGAPVASDWIEAPPQSLELLPPVNVSVSRQFVENSRLNAKIDWSYGDRPAAHRSCFYQLAWLNKEQADSVDFDLDESDGYVIRNLQFSQNYTILLKSISTTERQEERVESSAVGTLLVGKSCREMKGSNVTNCGLGQVADFRLVDLDEQTGTALVAWTPVDNDSDIAGYQLYYRSLPLYDPGHCPLVLEEHNFTVSTTSTNASLNLNRTTDGCTYSVQIVSFDDQNNMSRPAEMIFVYPERAVARDYATALAIFAVVLLTIMIAVGLFLGCWRCRQWLSSKSDRWLAVIQKWYMENGASSRNGPLRSNPLYRQAVVSDSGNRNSTILQGLAELEKGPVDGAAYDECPTFTAASLPEHFRIGSGRFGDVYLLHSTSLGGNVALKKFLQYATNNECKQKEVNAAKEVARGGHPNIVKMVGVFMTESNQLGGIVFEHCSGGDLKKYLTNVDLFLSSSAFQHEQSNWEPVFAEKLIAFCNQISSAMVFLSSLGYVHRDLAARNVLLSEHIVLTDVHTLLTKQTAKLSDFGLTRKLDDSTRIYRPMYEGVLPYKWMPPETLNGGDFLEKSDVWSFGVLMTEIVSLGKDPEVVQQSAFYNPMIPKGRSDTVLRSITSRHNKLDAYLKEKLVPIIAKCWQWREPDRPTFQEVMYQISQLD